MIPSVPLKNFFFVACNIDPNYYKYLMLGAGKERDFATELSRRRSVTDWATLLGLPLSRIEMLPYVHH